MTPHLAGLAKRLSGRPFHLIVNFSPPERAKEVIAHLRGHGLTEAIPNLTVAQNGGHDAIRGPVHVPYYFLFDHTGRLARHHMCGDDHDGADGLEMLDWTDKLLAKVPPIWLGGEPYVEIPKLAEQVAFKRKLAAVVKQLETAAPDAEGAAGAEMKRLLEAVTAWRDKEIERALSHLATEPKAALPALKELAAELKGTALGVAVTTQVESLKGSPALAAAQKIAAAYDKTMRKLERLKVPKAAAKRGVERFRLDDAECREAHARTLQREAKSLRKALEGHEELPIAARVQALIAQLEG